jgi:hypothetical protein
MTYDELQVLGECKPDSGEHAFEGKLGFIDTGGE